MKQKGLLAVILFLASMSNAMEPEFGLIVKSYPSSDPAIGIAPRAPQRGPESAYQSESSGLFKSCTQCIRDCVGFTVLAAMAIRGNARAAQLKQD